MPALGNPPINIITGNSITGTFDTIDMSGMPAGLTYHVHYLGNVVQLQVVPTPFFAADFDNDGDVDPTDYVTWRHAYHLNSLGDADGDNDSDAADFVIWRNQFGSVPGAGSGTSFLGDTAVPEPATAWMLIGGVLLAMWRHRRLGSGEQVE